MQFADSCSSKLFPSNLIASQNKTPRHLKELKNDNTQHHKVHNAWKAVKNFQALKEMDPVMIYNNEKSQSKNISKNERDDQISG